jgi:Arc/MetJ-type ribon-helix-helix transcriptional regulator
VYPAAPQGFAGKEVWMTVVQLTKEQEAIAQAAMATGRYKAPQEVIDAAFALLRERDRQRAEFVASLDAAEQEAEEKGWLEIEDVMAAIEADETQERAIEEAARRAAS